MTLPTLIVEAAFEDDPFAATPTWTDITQWVRSVQINRGKRSLFDRMPAGTCTVTVNNDDARFDPNNTSSPYAPYVLPMRRLRVKAYIEEYLDVYDERYGGGYGLFSGFLEGVPVDYPSNALFSTATLRAVDAFKVLNLRQVTSSESQEASGTRVGNVLDAAGWPAALRNIDAGETTVQASTLTDDNPLEHLLTVADSELGLLYMDGDGDVRFVSRHGLIGGVLDTGNYTFGAGALPYRGATFAFDDTDLWNEVKVSSQGVAEQTASDAASQTTYGRRTLSKSGLLLTSTSEQADHATFVLTGTKAPALRVEQMEPVGEASGGSWPRILDRELGAKVLVELDPPGAGDTISQPSFIEGIRWSIVPADWRCTWSLVPTDRRSDFWVLGDSVQSVLGSTTRLSF